MWLLSREWNFLTWKCYHLLLIFITEVWLCTWNLMPYKSFMVVGKFGYNRMGFVSETTVSNFRICGVTFSYFRISDFHIGLRCVFDTFFVKCLFVPTRRRCGSLRIVTHSCCFLWVVDESCTNCFQDTSSLLSNQCPIMSEIGTNDCLTRAIL